MDAAHLLGVIALMLTAAKLFGWLAQRIGQPAVLGELVAGVLLGGSLLGVVDTHDHVLHFLAELGVVILLFEIGLETDLVRLVAVGAASLTVAVVGVILPFALGYAVCRLWGLENTAAIVAGATLTATSVGITARVLSDLGRLARARESDRPRCRGDRRRHRADHPDSCRWHGGRNRGHARRNRQYHWHRVRLPDHHAGGRHIRVAARAEPHAPRRHAWDLRRLRP